MSHCDIKPANMVYNASTGRVLLIDFGLLRSFSEIFDKKYLFMLKHDYEWYPPEFKIMAANIIGDDVERWSTSNYMFAIQRISQVLGSSLFLHPEIGRLLQTFVVRGPGSRQKHTELIRLELSYRDLSIQDLATQYTKYAYGVDVYALGMTMVDMILRYVAIWPSSMLDDNNIKVAVAILRLAYNMTDLVAEHRLTPSDALGMFDKSVAPLLGTRLPSKRKSDPGKLRVPKAHTGTEKRKSRKASVSCPEGKIHNYETGKCRKAPQPKLKPRESYEQRIQRAKNVANQLVQKGVVNVVNPDTGRQIKVGLPKFVDMYIKYGSWWRQQ
jgi:serine/threonine protein kinase